MITKTTKPIIITLNSEEDVVVGTKVEYRIFGILLYKKTLELPNPKAKSFDHFYIRI